MYSVQLPSLNSVQCTASLLTVADDLTSSAPSSQLFLTAVLPGTAHSSLPPQSQSQSQSQSQAILTGRGTVLARTGIESVCLCRVGRPDCESQESHRLPASLPHRRPAHAGQGWARGWARGWLLARGWALARGWLLDRGWAGGQVMVRGWQALCLTGTSFRRQRRNYNLFAK